MNLCQCGQDASLTHVCENAADGMTDYKKPCGCWGKRASEDPLIYDEGMCKEHTASLAERLLLKVKDDEIDRLRTRAERAEKVVEAIRQDCSKHTGCRGIMEKLQEKDWGVVPCAGCKAIRAYDKAMMGMGEGSQEVTP